MGHEVVRRQRLELVSLVAEHAEHLEYAADAALPTALEHSAPLVVDARVTATHVVYPVGPSHLARALAERAPVLGTLVVALQFPLEHVSQRILPTGQAVPIIPYRVPRVGRYRC